MLSKLMQLFCRHEWMQTWQAGIYRAICVKCLKASRGVESGRPTARATAATVSPFPSLVRVAGKVIHADTSEFGG